MNKRIDTKDEHARLRRAAGSRRKQDKAVEPSAALPRHALLDEIEASMQKPALLRQALTHSSHADSASQGNYERLEFLGDAVLGLVAVEAIYQKFPQTAEGPLARLKATLVSAKTLSSIAEEYGLFESARLGDMPPDQLEMARLNVGADVVEAIIGAVYLDQGLEAARALVLRFFGERLRDATIGGTGARDAKTTLHELVQGRLHDRPTYAVIQEEGQAHARRFCVEVRIRGVLCGTAWGTSHKAAEQGAATEALARIEAKEIELEKLRSPEQ